MVDFDKVKVFSAYARRAVSQEYLDELATGQTLRVLLDPVGEFTKDEKGLVVESIAETLRDRSMLESAEFYEGLGGALRSRTVVSLLRSAYFDSSDDCSVGTACPFCRVLSILSSSGAISLKGAHLHELKEVMEPPHVRLLVSRLAEASCDDVAAVTQLLRRFFHPSEEFEVAEAVRTLTHQDWWIDIVPRDRKRAERFFKESMFAVFPSTAVVVNSWLNRDACNDEWEEDNGSDLDSFIVDDDEEDDEEDDDDCNSFVSLETEKFRYLDVYAGRSDSTELSDSEVSAVSSAQPTPKRRRLVKLHSL